MADEQEFIVDPLDNKKKGDTGKLSKALDEIKSAVPEKKSPALKQGKPSSFDKSAILDVLKKYLELAEISGDSKHFDDAISFLRGKKPDPETEEEPDKTEEETPESSETEKEETPNEEPTADDIFPPRSPNAII